MIKIQISLFNNAYKIGINICFLFIICFNFPNVSGTTDNRQKADSLLQEGTDQFLLGRTREAIFLTEQALIQLKETEDTKYISNYTALCNLARYHANLHHNSEALNAVEEAMRYRNELGFKRDLNYANLLYTKGKIFVDNKRFDEAVSCFDEIITISRRNLAFGGEGLLIDAFINKAVTLIRLERYEEAKNFIGSVSFQLKNVNEKNILYLTHNFNELLDIIFQKTGDSDGVRKIRKSQEELTNVLKEKYPSLYAVYLKEKAADAFETGELDKVVYYAEEALNYDPIPLIKIEVQRLLSIVHFNRGEYDKMYPYAMSMLSEIESRPVLDSGRYATIIQILLNYYLHKGRYVTGINFALDKGPFIKNLYGAESAEFAGILSNMTALYIGCGKLKEAKEAGFESLRIRENCIEKSDDDISVSLINLSQSFFHAGQYEEALKYLDRAEELILNKTITEYSHKKLASIYDSKTVVYGKLGQYDKAVEYSDKATDSYYKSNIVDYTIISTILNNKLVIYSDIGDDVTARKIIDEITGMIERGELTPEHTVYLSSMNTMGYVLMRFANYDRAIRYLNEANERLTQINPIHPLRCTVLNNLGLIYSNLNENETAVQYYAEAIAVGKEAGIDNSKDLILARRNMISDIINLNPVLAKEMFQKEFSEIRQKKTEDLAIEDAIIFGQYAFLLAQEDHIEEALEYSRKCLNIFEDSGINKSSIARSYRLDHLLLLAQSGKVDDFVKLAKTVGEETSFDLRTSFPMLTEEERYDYWKNNLEYWYSFILPVALNLNGSNAELNRLVFDGLLKSRGVLLGTTMALSELIQSTNDKILKNIFDELNSARATYKSLPENASLREIDMLQDKIYRLEQQLNSRSKDVDDFMKGFDVSIDEVRNNINPGEVIIEFVIVPQFEGLPTYGALIMTKDSRDIEYINLGNLHEFYYFNNRDDKDLKFLGNTIFKPLDKYVKIGKKIYFTPDGILHTLPIEAALYSYVRDNDITSVPTIHRLTSSRQLAIHKENKEIKSAAVFGGIDYDSSTGKQSVKFSNTKYSISVSGIDRDLFRDTEQSIPILKGTLKEAISADKILKQSNINVNLKLGKDGTEGEFKNLSGENYSLIHIGTHGFYWSEDEAKNFQQLSFLRGAFSKHKNNEEDRSLLRSGLLFAGATNTLFNLIEPNEGEEDGVLTAREIAGMNLKYTDLVVLSACKTGLGDISSDGVFGLQRGFKKAGAKAIVMSLWSVDDIATGVFMEQFYNELTKGHSPYSAAENAKEYLRNFKDATGNKPFSSFRYWAPFVLVDSF